MEEEIRKETELMLYRQMAADVMNNGSCSPQIIDQLRSYGEPFKSIVVDLGERAVNQFQRPASNTYGGAA